MAALLDTNVAILLRDADVTDVSAILRRFLTPVLSVVTVAELEGGVATDGRVDPIRRTRLDRLLREATVLDLDRTVVGHYRRIVEACGYSRRKVLDRLIAATALAHGIPLVTANAADFRDIPGLDLQVWPAPQ